LFDGRLDEFRLQSLDAYLNFLWIYLMDGANQKQPELLLANCLNCRGLVRIPSNAIASQQVRCPHCSESYFLGQILEGSIPELEIVEEQKADSNVPHVDQIASKSANEDEREVFVVPPQLSKGARRNSSRRRSDDSTSNESFNEGPSRARSERKPARRGTSRKSSANQRSPVLEMIKVIIGGALAIPIAYLLVFWVFRQDPLSVGPSIGKVAPFLVPKDLRGDDVIDIQKKKSEAEKLDQETTTPKDSSLMVPELDPDKVLKDIGS